MRYAIALILLFIAPDVWAQDKSVMPFNWGSAKDWDGYLLSKRAYECGRYSAYLSIMPGFNDIRKASGLSPMEIKPPIAECKDIEDAIR